MKIASTIQQVNKTKSQIAANKGTNNNANNSAAVAQPRARTDTVTLSKKSLTLAAKTATKNIEHRLGVAPVMKETTSQSSDNGHGNEEGSGNLNAVSLFSLSNNFNSALQSYKDVQKAEGEINHVL